MRRTSDSVKDLDESSAAPDDHQEYAVELLQFTENGDYEKCKELLEGGDVNIDEKDEETQFTVAHIAARHNRLDIMEFILTKGVDVNLHDRTGKTPLHFAVKKGHIACSQMILAYKDLNINSVNNINATPLHYAAREGRQEICEMILKHPDVQVNAKTKKGMTPLHYAAQENHSKILELLLKNGADCTVQDVCTHLALHYAAKEGNSDCCAILVSLVRKEDKAKQLKSCLKNGHTPLMLAAKEGHHGCCSKLEFRNINAKDKKRNTALHFATVGGYERTVKVLLEAGADPNIANLNDNTPLLDAAVNGKFWCLKVLAEKGADLTVHDKKGRNVLHYAAEKNALEALIFLLKYSNLKSMINKTDKNQFSPFHLAINNKEPDHCAILLLENGASPTCNSSGKMSPLHLAASKGSTTLCEILLSRSDVQVNQENKVKENPLHLAASYGSTKLCYMLISKGARLAASDHKGRTALHIASMKGHTRVVKFLSKKKFLLNRRDDTGSLALHLAASVGCLECCRVLVETSKKTCWDMDQNGKLPLDRSFKEGDNISFDSLDKYDQVFKLLIQNLPFNEHQDEIKLRIHNYMGIALERGRGVIVDAIVDSSWWEAGISGEEGHHCKNFRWISKMYPDIAEKLLNHCIRTCKDKVTYDFQLFEDNYYIPSDTSMLAKSPFHPNTHKLLPGAIAYTKDGLAWKNDHPLTWLITHQHHQLLQHPLVGMWISRKWKSYIKFIFGGLVLRDVLFVVFLAFFMSFAVNWKHIQENCSLTRQAFCSIANNLSSTSFLYDKNVTPPYERTTVNEYHHLLLSEANSTTLSQYYECNKNMTIKIGLWWGLFIFIIANIGLGINYVWKLRQEYFKSGHILHACRTMFALVLLIPIGACEFQYMILKVISWQFGLIALLLSWLHLVSTLNQLPVLSVFMPVTMSFTKSFLKVVFYLMMILFGFAYSFHLLLKDQDAFSTVTQSTVKTIVWMLGDLGYDDTFLNDDHKLLFPILVNCLFVVFVTTLSGFIVNLLITQPETKLDDYREKASFNRAANRTKLLLKLDVCFPCFQKRRMVGKYIEDKSNTDGHFTKKILRLNDKVEKIGSEKNDISNIQVQLEELRDEMSDLRRLILSLDKSISYNKK